MKASHLDLPRAVDSQGNRKLLLKIRRIPEDFEVEEITDLKPASGPFALYRLQKQGLGTLEAIHAIAQRWRIDRRNIAVGGLKDRHAITIQYLTIDHGPRRNLTQQHMSLTYLGQVSRSYSSNDIAHNRFRITVRNLETASATRLSAVLNAIELDGILNYFDDQRFGSLGESGEFIARSWIERNYERACWLVLCDPVMNDSSAERQERLLIADKWTDWVNLQPLLAASYRRDVVDYLVRHPFDFRRALTRVDHDQRRLFLASFQSWLWNEVLAETLRRSLPAPQLIPLSLRPGRVVTFNSLTGEQRAALHEMQLPFPTSRQRPEGATESIMDDVLGRVGLERRQLKIDYPRDSFFSKGERAAIFLPKHVTVQESEDELTTGRKKADIAFELPRGCYATMVIKQAFTLTDGLDVEL